MPKKPAFYAVQRGRSTGVFTSWAECEASVKSYTGAVFKRFDDATDARAFVASVDGYRSSSSSSSSKRPPSSTDAASDLSSVKRARHSGPSSSSSSSATTTTEGGRGVYSNPTFPRPPSLPSSSSSAASGAARTIHVYVDGSGLGNGTKGARAGWGVYWDDESLHSLNEARRLPGPIQTNNRGELMAMIRAIQLCPDASAQLIIHTDSQYSVDCVEKWLPTWRRNNWTSASGKPVLNRDLIQRLDWEMSNRAIRPRLSKVLAHSGVEGNEMADRLAKHGAGLPDEIGEGGLALGKEEEGGGGDGGRGKGAGERDHGDGEVLKEAKTKEERGRKGEGVDAVGADDHEDELAGLDEDAFMSPEELQALERGE